MVILGGKVTKRTYSDFLTALGFLGMLKNNRHFTILTLISTRFDALKLH